MGRASKTAAIFLTLTSLSFAQELKACYRAYLVFLPVAETCITYRVENNQLRVESFARTINVGKVVKRVYNRGGAIIEIQELKPTYFFYYQEEGEFKRRQEYRFSENRIEVSEVKYVKLSDDVEKREAKEYEQKGFVDPYTASLLLYREVLRSDKGTVKMFYDGREYFLPYAVKSRERVETPAGSFRTRKVEVHPNVETKGLLKPRGVWYLWVDEDMRIPVRMELKFVIGSATAKLESVEGDKGLVKRLVESRGATPP